VTAVAAVLLGISGWLAVLAIDDPPAAHAPMPVSPVEQAQT
jgi:hypothetical protein